MKKTKLNGASENVSVSLPGWLIEIMDEVCERHDSNRSMFVKHAIKKAILSKLDSPELWEKLYQGFQDES